MVANFVLLFARSKMTQEAQEVGTLCLTILFQSHLP